MSLLRQLSKYKLHSSLLNKPKSNTYSIEYPIHVFPKQQLRTTLLKVLIYLQLVKVLRLTMASLDGPSELQNLVSKRRLAMINMSDDGKIPIQQNHTNGTSKKY